MYCDERYPSSLVSVWDPISTTSPYGFDCIPSMLKREMQAFQLDSFLLSIDNIIISDGFDKKCFVYRKVKIQHVYLWRGLTRYL